MNAVNTFYLFMTVFDHFAKIVLNFQYVLIILSVPSLFSIIEN